MTERGVHGAPDLAVEIVDSPKARRDAVQKQVRYEEIGVQEHIGHVPGDVGAHSRVRGQFECKGAEIADAITRRRVG